MIVLEAIIIAIIVISTAIYVSDFNNSHFQPINTVNLTEVNQWSHSKRLEVTYNQGIMTITSNNTVYASYPTLNSKEISVHSGETLLFSVYAKYSNTAQSTMRIIGDNGKGEIYLGYLFGANGNSTWHPHSIIITIPNGISSVFIQLPIGWVISNSTPEVVMLKDLLIYNVRGT